jgi:hypothetical protein
MTRGKLLSLKADGMPESLREFSCLILQEHIADVVSAMPSDQLYVITHRVPWLNSLDFRNVSSAYFNIADPARRCARPMQDTVLNHNLLYAECTPDAYAKR